MWIRWLASVGAANLLFLTEWRDVSEVYSHKVGYFTTGPFPLAYVSRVVMATVAMGTILFAVLTLVEPLLRSLRSSSKDLLMALAATIAAVVVWFGATPSLVSFEARLGVGVLIVGAGTFFVVQPEPWIRRLLPQLLAASAVTLPVFVATAIARHVTHPSVASPPSIRSVSAEPVGRVVWVVFDELDATLTTSNRPIGVELDAFDRLRAESLEASRAHAPGRWTVDAMATLWTGHPVSDAREVGPTSLSLTFAGSPAATVSDGASSVFGRAYDAGARVGIAGWHHPYCRLFGAVVATCLAVSNESANFALRRARVLLQQRTGLAVLRLLDWHAPRTIDDLLRGGATAHRLSLEEAYARERHGATYREVHQRTLEMAGDAGLALVFAHYPIPHLPRVGGERVDGEDSSADSEYFDNLRLFDRTLLEIRAAMESARLWEATTVIVHSDHALRPALWTRLGTWGPVLQASTGGVQGALTPFVVKVAGAPATRVRYDTPFSAALTADLVVSLLDGRLRQYADVVAWLDANRGRVPLAWPVRTPLDE